VRLAVDVGLDSSVPSHQGEGTKNAATIDARHRTRPRRHDMAAANVAKL